MSGSNGEMKTQVKILMGIVGTIFAALVVTLLGMIVSNSDKGLVRADEVATQMRLLTDEAAKIHAQQAERIAKLEVVIPAIYKDIQRIESGQERLIDKLEAVHKEVQEVRKAQ